MIQVIKHGNIRKVCICYHCGCEFSYEDSDTKTIQTGIQEYKKYVRCPDCATDNDAEFGGWLAYSKN